MKQTFLRIERITTHASMLFACAMLAAAAGLGVFQTLTRFALEKPAEWTEVLIRFTLIWMVFMGIPMAFRQGAMVSVDVPHRWVKPRRKRVPDVVVMIASLTLIAIIIVIGWDYAERGRVQTIIGLEEYSMFWAYLSMPVGGLFAVMGIILGAVGLLLVGSRCIAPAVLDKGLSEQTMERYSHLIGVTLFAAYFIVLSCIPKLRASLNGRAAYALMMPVIILGGIHGGVFTPTEASAVAVIYALFVGMAVYREISLKDLLPIFKKCTLSSAVIMFIIANAGLFAYLITRPGVPDAIGLLLKQWLQSPMLILLGVNAALFIIGMFIETSASIIVLAPILAPVAIHFGIDPVHFGIIMVVNLALGMITPPFGVNLFAACTVAKISLDRIVTQLVPFVLVVLTCVMVITYIPAISLFLRDLVYAK